MGAGQDGLNGHPAPSSVELELREDRGLAPSQLLITEVETVGARILIRENVTLNSVVSIYLQGVQKKWD